mmetsp:Transcript_2878/g.6662  ORF Transcript_2878/g.6662 Transcript_2878/m.6662 type:complete len:296 (-) Transcript_2878:940-1827(-)
MAPGWSQLRNGCKRLRTEEEVDAVRELTHKEQMSLLTTIESTCHTKGLCCIYDAPSSSGSHANVDEALELLRECRLFIAPMSVEEQNLFLAAEFNASILNFADVLDASAPLSSEVDQEADEVDEIEGLRQRLAYCMTCADDPAAAPPLDVPEPTPKWRRRFNHDFRVQNRATGYTRKPVCTSCWRGLYGFSKWKVDETNKLKTTNSMTPNPHTIDDYDDTTLHDFSNKESVENRPIISPAAFKIKSCEGCTPLLTMRSKNLFFPPVLGRVTFLTRNLSQATSAFFSVSVSLCFFS